MMSWRIGHQLFERLEAFRVANHGKDVALLAKNGMIAEDMVHECPGQANQVQPKVTIPQENAVSS